jgi:hypothetical protein
MIKACARIVVQATEYQGERQSIKDALIQLPALSFDRWAKVKSAQVRFAPSAHFICQKNRDGMPDDIINYLRQVFKEEGTRTTAGNSNHRHLSGNEISSRFQSFHLSQ